ncbi:MAG: tRNA guanosine(34) transglycosylase Tgt [Candidatus Falkowbacteria bacterium]|nr:tRNA guanosine(34) transglycosylase Tgt [Candidatus Falkowbacteria bacterium]
MSFKLIKQSNKSKARLGVLKTAHGEIETPFFMPVATQGAVKHVSTEEMRSLGSPILLANTYHLLLKPGAQAIKKFGGLHKFMDWTGPILTDSGGFQIFSLAGHRKKGGEKLVKLTSQGVYFKSYIDGSQHYLTPAKALRIQIDLGVDVAVCLDECVALPAEKKQLAESVDLTTSWAARTKKYYQQQQGKKPLLFAVIQGGLDRELRLKSLYDLLALGFDGYNIGGLSVGETATERNKVLAWLLPAMPADKPRYLMGVGYPEDILAAVKRGVDMFDCVIPTREGRHGRLFLWTKEAKLPAGSLASKRNSNFYETINITKAEFKNDKTSINKESKLPELRNLSKAYLHYLFNINEPLGQRLATLNNLEFYLDKMAKIRADIKNGKL